MAGTDFGGNNMKMLSTLAVTLCLAATMAGCSKPAPAAASNEGANAGAAASPNAVAPAAPAAADSAEPLVGKWLDDENDTYSFAADGTITSTGQVSMTGTWKKDGEDRYDIDLNSPAGLSQGLACVTGDTMVAHIGGDELTYLGRIGADGQAAKPDTTLKCE